MLYTRRELAGLALAALPAGYLLPRSAWTSRQAGKPNSKWAGVQVGMNVPYNFHAPAPVGNNMDADEVLKRCLQLGVSAIELRSQPVELFMGLPLDVLSPPRAAAPAPAAADAPAGRRAGAAPAETRPCNVPAPPSPRDNDQAEAPPAPTGVAADLRKWRVSAPMAKAAALRKKYEDAGVAIQILKWDNILGFTDDVMDYAFLLAKQLGARAISCELPTNQVLAAKRLGRFADKHQIMIGFHGHTLMTDAIWEQAFGYAKYNGANLDIGHYIAGNNTSPVPFLKKHHDRITHIHVKDRKLNCGENVPFGQGDTPIKEVLQLIRDSKWNIQATIEFEYRVPAGSDAMAEMAKCMEYCKQCLLG